MTEMVEKSNTTMSMEQKRELLQRLLAEQVQAPSASGFTGLSGVAIEPDPDRRHDPFPLTEIQQAYWIGRSSAYDLGDVSIHAYAEVDGDAIDVPRLQQSWQKVVLRHDMLRAVVLPDGRQRVLSSVPLYEVQVTNLRNQASQTVGNTLAAIRDELSHQVLDAGAWPAFEIRATLLDGARTRVHISIDLLHVDGGSLMILVGEWMRLYHESAVVLPPLDLAYRDYVLAERAGRGSEAHRRSAEYWHGRVTSLPLAPALPRSPLSGTCAPTRFHHRRATLEAPTWRRLKARAATAGLTPSAVLLTAYAEVLARWSKDDDFTLNVTLFNRLPLHPQVNQILGDFTSMIPVEVSFGAGVSFADCAAIIQKDLWAGLSNRQVSGIQVLRDLAQAQKRTTGAPLPVVFTSMLDLAGQGLQPPFSSLRTIGDVVYSVTQTPQVWLDHQVLEDDGALVLTWDAVDDLFPPGLLDDMFAEYSLFVAALADDDNVWGDLYRTHVPAEQMSQRDSVNATDAAVPDETLLTLFLRQADVRPDAPAVITSDRTLSYADLRSRANRLGRLLRTSGAEPDALVAVVMNKGWEQAVATLGVHFAGAAYLPVDPDLPTERRNILLRDGHVRWAVTQPCLDEGLEWPADIARICISPEDDAEPTCLLTPVQMSDHLSHVIYTSGSTGVPKGVMIEHRSAVNRLLDVNRRLGVGSDDRVLALTALHHDMSVYDIFGMLAAGAAMVIPDAAGTRDPRHWAELMTKESVTIWNSVPAFLQMFLEYLEQHRDRPDLLPRQLRHAVLSGDWVPVGLPDRLRALVGTVHVMTCGGPTETTTWDICYSVGTVDAAWPSIPYGKPMQNTHYYVLNRALQPCPVWVPGQLHIGGAGLARGYWRDEARTEERFIVHPVTGERIYRSGDIGRFLPDGNIEFLGREDSQVKIRGHRIELGEVEHALQQHPAVTAAVVTAVGERRQLQRLVAYVVPTPGSVPADIGAAEGSAAGTVAHPTDTLSVPQWYPADITLQDPLERIDFKLHQWGVRRDADRKVIPFGKATPDEALVRSYGARRSASSFSTDRVPFAVLGALLGNLTQIQVSGLPKYRYASGGGLYPVQTYVYIKADRVEGLLGGIYYHDPRDHQLVLISADPAFDASTQVPHNRALFDEAAFAIFLVGQLAAVEPLYGALGRDFCLLEAGYMSQLLMSDAATHRLALCPIGAMDFAGVHGVLDLDDTHIPLHFLFGGLADGAAEPRPLTSPPQGTSSSSQADLISQLRTAMSLTLPRQMQPSAYVLLESLPLTSNGKVDRQLLPSLDVAEDPGQSTYRPPRNDAERALAAIAQRILRTERLGIHQNFFDLGGNSIHMVQILNEVRVAFGREVPVTEIFRHPTVSALAAYLSDEDASTLTAARTDDRAKARRESLRRRDSRRRDDPETDREGAVPR